MQPQPIETVVFYPLALRLPLDPSPPPPEPTPLDPLDVLTADVQRAVAGLVVTALSAVRLRILLALASADSTSVLALAQLLGEPPDKVSGHLRPLRDGDLVREQRRGKEHWYACTPARVQFTPHDDGGFALTVAARKARRPVRITLEVGGENPSPETTGSG